MLDLASRYRETLLFNIWRMGMNSIEQRQPGSLDRDAQAHRGARSGSGRCAATAADGRPRRTRRRRQPAAGGDVPAGGGTSAAARAMPSELYDTVLHDPAIARSARLHHSVRPGRFRHRHRVRQRAAQERHHGARRRRAAFAVAGKNYPAGSYVVKTAQAFRPHVLDMFEPQDHPNDFAYPGGPPMPPYDITGWTLAMQMGVEYDRILDGFDGPFTKINGLLPPPPGSVVGPANPAGYLISHASTIPSC